jgi:hypothetical protein
LARSSRRLMDMGISLLRELPFDDSWRRDSRL